MLFGTTAYWNSAQTVSVHRCGICERAYCIFKIRIDRLYHGLQKKFKMHHSVPAVKKYEGTAGYNEYERPSGSSAAIGLHFSWIAQRQTHQQLWICTSASDRIMHSSSLEHD